MNVVTSKSTRVPWDYIKSRPALLSLCDKLHRQNWIALDTEFMRERTYFAKLCLLQIASETSIACIDPLALDSIDPLLDLLYETHRVKILHSARQDLELFYDLRANIPTPIFDTQVAAALLGHSHQIGYANLVKTITGVELEKGHTRTDWAIRPLNQAQLHYAVDDVRFLSDLYQHLSDKLAELDRLEWLQQECATLADLKLYSNDPEVAYQRIKHTGNLTSSALTRLKSLAAWRERQARTSNLPRHWILRDAALVELAGANPQEIEQLQTIKSLTPKNISRWGKMLLELLKQAEPMKQVAVVKKQPLSKKNPAIASTSKPLSRTDSTPRHGALSSWTIIVR